MGLVYLVKLDALTRRFCCKQTTKWENVELHEEHLL